ncbi:MAG: hypothetical protein QNJ55_20285 [Xenococcus sp. MO_188.B8]|nr:hypothetical protein [Xenococcus sp. MO_188.B8]
MTQTPTNIQVKLLSPTLHFYHYRLRNSINESLEDTKERRQKFEENLQAILSHLTSKTGQKASEFLKLIDIEQESSKGTILDLTNVPPDCKKSTSDLLYLETGILKTSLAARLLNDTYFLRLTRYISSTHHEQSIDSFANLSEYLNTVKAELGQTAILAGILQTQLSPQETRKIAVNCLHKYLSHISESEIEDQLSEEYRFLDSPFYVLSREITIEKFTENYQLKTKNLACVFLYKDEDAERKANRVYSIFQDLLLSYHKINYFYLQSRNLKIQLNQRYKAIEQQTENYQQQNWDTQSLVKMPQESLEYYRFLSSLQDQARLIEIQQHNYQVCIQQIEQEIGDTIPKFFTDFQQDIVFYLEQMKADISFLSPAIQLYERLMLSVQTQVSINEAAIQEKQAKLGQILTVAGTTIALGQIAQKPITTTISQQIIDKDQSLPSPSLLSLWISASVTILLSLTIGLLISRLLYQWFTKK